jgi:putative glycosyltransferase (TIGR04348 family)
VILGLGGTDLYRDLVRHPSSGDSLVLADGIVVLQPEALRKLPPAARKKARVIFQSEPFRRRKARVNRRSFDVCVLSNLRGLKDPLRAALASRYVPAASRIRILHAGEAVDPALARRARAEMVRNHRYRWFGSLPRSAALRLLEKSDLLVVSSEMEGGANVVSEALARSVPVVASRIPGNLGMLGRDYAGYYKLRDTKQLARLLLRAESDPDFLNRLAASCRRRRELIRPARERKAWRELISELVKPRRRSRRVSRK